MLQKVKTRSAVSLRTAAPSKLLVDKRRLPNDIKIDRATPRPPSKLWITAIGTP